MRPPMLMHVMPGFGPGGAQTRIVTLINAFGTAFRHAIVSLSGETGAGEGIDARAEVRYIRGGGTRNPVAGIRFAGRLLKDCRPDLVLTYNWGSMDAVCAAALGRYPLIHTEDGFGEDEAAGQKGRRVLIRSILLRRAHKVIAPSLTLLRLMRERWKLPAARTTYIPNGIDLERFQPCLRDAAGELVIGTVGQLRPEKRQDRLIELFAGFAAHHRARLRIAGEGPERAKLVALARALDIAERVEFLGYRRDVENVYRGLDLFVLTSSTEQMPTCVLEAMACGLPVLSTDVGDVSHIVSAANRPFIRARPDALAADLVLMAGSPCLRREVGAANRTHAQQNHGTSKMLRDYGDLYRNALVRRVPLS